MNTEVTRRSFLLGTAAMATLASVSTLTGFVWKPLADKVLLPDGFEIGVFWESEYGKGHEWLKEPPLKFECPVETLVKLKWRYKFAEFPAIEQWYSGPQGGHLGAVIYPEDLCTIKWPEPIVAFSNL